MSMILISYFNHEVGLTSYNHSTIGWCLSMNICCNCWIGSRIIKISSEKRKEEKRWLFTQILLMIDITNQGMPTPRKVQKVLCWCYAVQEVDERQSESWYCFCTAALSQLCVQAALTWANWKWPLENNQKKIAGGCQPGYSLSVCKLLP